MSFLEAMSGESASVNITTKTGINGSTVYTAEGVDDPRVALFTSAVRDCESSFIEEQLDKIIAAGHIEDAWLLAFQTRDIRGGKGERLVFYKMLKWLLLVAPAEQREHMIRIIPEYGSWHDLIVLLGELPERFHGIMLKMINDQLVADEVAMGAGKSVSLLAKWLPREKSAHTDLAFKIAGSELSMSVTHRRYLMTRYRKRCAALNKYLKTVEINMCGANWASIKPDHVPGRCLNLNRKAFLNETADDTRRSSSEDRIKCADNFRAHMAAVGRGEATVKGANTVFPHDVTRKITTATVDETAVLEAQWSSIRSGAGGGALARTVVLSDVSGSMAGRPMEISIALGILISELNSETFKDHIMTFHTTPSWINLSTCGSLKEKVATVGRAPWGGSTNFEGALDLILHRLIEGEVAITDAPDDLLVLTDMGWDAATSGHRFHLDAIKSKWSAAGYKVPRIIIWNLSANFKDYHAKADTEGVITVSGWSPSVLKLLFAGNIKVSTPYETMRAALDDARYDLVRSELKAGATV
jgi:hypothetical protein